MYSFAHLFAPKNNSAQPWTNDKVKKDAGKMLKRYFPDTAERSQARLMLVLSLNRYIE